MKSAAPLVLALLALAASGCSRGRDTASAAATAAPAAVVATSKSFGAPCVANDECAGGVCFHKRIKGADAGPERRDVRPEAEEHDGYCSMKCKEDTDCPVPPTRGKCGARGCEGSRLSS